MNASLSVIIPTYNRPDYLARTLNFLFSSPARTCVTVIVEDGSDDAHAQLNRKTCDQLQGDIRYFHQPTTPSEEPWHNYNRRLVHALSEAQSPYTAFCADDDLLVLESALEAAKFLDANSEFVACHGKYLQFRYAGNAINVERIVYDGASIDADTVAGRFGQMYSHYEAPFYAVYRRERQQKCFERYMKVERPLWPETYHSTATIVEGKIKRLQNIYSLRNAGIAPHHQAIDTFSRWMAIDLDDFNTRYRNYRADVTQWTAAQSLNDFDKSRFQRAVDMAFMLYVTKEFEPKFWIDEFSALVGEADRHRLRERITATLLPNQNIVSIDKTSPLAVREALKLAVNLTLGTKAIRLFQTLRNSIFRRPVRKQDTSGFNQTDFLSVAASVKNSFTDEQWSLVREKRIQ